MARGYALTVYVKADGTEWVALEDFNEVKADRDRYREALERINAVTNSPKVPNHLAARHRARAMARSALSTPSEESK